MFNRKTTVQHFSSYNNLFIYQLTQLNSTCVLYKSICFNSNIVSVQRNCLKPINLYRTFSTSRTYFQLDFLKKKNQAIVVTPASGSVKFLVGVHFSKTIEGIHLKLGILVHYQKRNQLQQADDPVICISRVICPCFYIVHRNQGYFFSIIKISQ